MANQVSGIPHAAKCFSCGEERSTFRYSFWNRNTNQSIKVCTESCFTIARNADTSEENIPWIEFRKKIKHIFPQEIMPISLSGIKTDVK